MYNTRAKSKFHKFFETFMNETVAKLDVSLEKKDHLEDNEYYCPQFLKILNKYMYFYAVVVWRFVKFR